MIPYKTVIELEHNEIHFEKFCTALLEATEHITLVTTSKTYDLGRDARSISKSRGTHAHILCATIAKEITPKVIADLERLTDYSIPDHLFYCCSLSLTEHTINVLTGEIRKYVPAECSVAVLGAGQLAYRAEKQPELFRNFFRGEVQSIEQAFVRTQSPHSKIDTQGLRLALLAFGSEDVQNLRRAISTRVVLDSLARGQGCTTDEIAKVLSDDLRLHRPLNADFVYGILQECCLQGLTLESKGCWTLTEKGVVEAKSIPPEAAQELLKGSEIVRQSLETLIGQTIANLQFEKIWSTLLDFLSELFYTNGLSIITAVEQFLNPKAAMTTHSADLEQLLEDGVARIRSVVSTPESAGEIAQAVKDVFTERGGPAFEWLASVCERFVALCALGLESTSSEELKTLIVRSQLVLDTDIILKYLCEHELDHDAATDVLIRWRQIGGKILLSVPVLEEVANHAWISHREFNGTKHLLGRVPPLEFARYTTNQFVRNFHALVFEGAASADQWNLFIDQYKGETQFDFSRIVQILQTDLAAERLPEVEDETLKVQISMFLQRLSSSRKSSKDPGAEQNEIFKAQRDGRILASIASARQSHWKLGTNSTVVLFSSSHKLKKADAHFRPKIGAPESVIGPGALSYMLSLLPDVRLGVGTMRRALFEFGQTGRLADKQKLAMRVIRGTSVYQVPWARRGTLEGHLDKVLREEANKRGAGTSEMRAAFVKAEESGESAQLILKALEAMAISDQRDTELALAKRKVQELEDALSRTPKVKK